MIHMTRKGEGIELQPDSEIAKTLIRLMFENTKSQKISFSARHPAGTLFCEFVKDCDYKPTERAKHNE